MDEKIPSYRMNRNFFLTLFVENENSSLISSLGKKEQKINVTEIIWSE